MVSSEPSNTTHKGNSQVGRNVNIAIRDKTLIRNLPTTLSHLTPFRYTITIMDGKPGEITAGGEFQIPLEVTPSGSVIVISERNLPEAVPNGLGNPRLRLG